jgi:hypothetical protein
MIRFSGVAREYYGDMLHGGHVVSKSQSEGDSRSLVNKKLPFYLL